jgi:sugar lactone lactonase YvrE
MRAMLSELPRTVKGVHVSMRRSVRIVVACTLATIGLLLPTATPAPARNPTGSFPTIIPLPNGFQPEGIDIGPGPFAYFGSRITGAIYRADLRTGAGRIIAPPSTPVTPGLGLKTDYRGRLFVAGARSGAARVIDLRTGRVLARYQFATPAAPPAPPGTFVNDVILTPDAAYFTDSFRAVLYKLPLGRHGELPPADGFVTIPLTGDWTQVAGQNANGIVRTPDGRGLIIVQSVTGRLFRVDPATGVTQAITVPGEPLIGGDGLLLIGRTLYAVRNLANLVVVIRLDRSATSGTVVDSITSPNFEVPTTVAAFGHRLYLPNFRPGIPDPDQAPYNAVAVPRR